MTPQFRTSQGCARSRRLSAFLVGITAFGLAGLPDVAAAEVAVLGLQSVEGDDEFAANMTGALRYAVAEFNGWDVNEREMSLAQMMLLSGCDSPDDACLAQIASTMQVEQVVYGTVRRSGGGPNFRFQLEVKVFDAAAGEVTQQAEDSLSSRLTDIDDLREPAERLARSLSGQTDPMGTIRITANAPGAQIRLNGDPMGALTGDEFVTEAPPGNHRLEIIADGYETFRQTVRVEAGASAVVEATLIEGESDGGGEIIAPTVEEGGGGGFPFIPVGGVFLGLGAAATVTFIIAWTQMSGYDHNGPGGANDDAEWNRVQSFYSPNEDVCTEARAGRIGGAGTAMDISSAVDICDEQDRLETLFNVGLSVAIATYAIGTGLILAGVLSGEDDDADPNAATLRLDPVFGPDLAGVGASGRF
ncbi:MAG: PEGA domain-containing protein [Myxococcota bacterium]